MSLRRKNLLEAFKKSEAPTPAPAPAAPQHSPVPAQSSAPLFDSAPVSSARPRKDVTRALVLVGLVLSFVIGFLVGRSTPPGEARAEKPAALNPEPRPVNQPRAFQERPPASTAPAATPVAETPAGEKRIEDSALFDPANLQTVVVASYTKSNQDLAWATYYHLQDAKLPVFPPVESRNLVVVLAGAAPTSAELQKTLASVQALSRDGKKKDYSDAYCARIDTLIPRPKKANKP